MAPSSQSFCLPLSVVEEGALGARLETAAAPTRWFLDRRRAKGDGSQSTGRSPCSTANRLAATRFTAPVLA